MKLINKKTGEIVEFVGCTAKGMRTFLRFDDLNGAFKFEVNSLAELINNGWEDYQESESFWYISPTGTPIKSTTSIYDPLEIHLMKRIGNYFESEEDAEMAVEKLEALKRLKSHNLRVERGQRISVNADNKLTSQKPLFVVDTYGEVEDDLDSLFDDDDYEPTNAEINDLTDMGYGG